MKQKQVYRHIHDEVHYTFENNTLALQQVDVQKNELWKLVQENQCQPLIDELNQEAETDFVLFSSQENEGHCRHVTNRWILFYESFRIQSSGPNAR